MDGIEQKTLVVNINKDVRNINEAETIANLGLYDMAYYDIIIVNSPNQTFIIKNRLGKRGEVNNIQL